MARCVCWRWSRCSQECTEASTSRADMSRWGVCATCSGHHRFGVHPIGIEKPLQTEQGASLLHGSLGLLCRFFLMSCVPKLEQVAQTKSQADHTSIAWQYFHSDSPDIHGAGMANAAYQRRAGHASLWMPGCATPWVAPTMTQMVAAGWKHQQPWSF